jgi:PHD/YefM family antitoxin component YafN of YafNO toxin-antitoxin module
MLSFKPPRWKSLFKRLQKVPVRSFRSNFAETCEYVIQQRGPLLITNHGRVYVGLVSSYDVALLIALRKHPALLRELKSKYPELQEGP